MAKAANPRRRYKIKLVHGALYVGRQHVKTLIDHDDRVIAVSDQVDVAERLELAAKAMRLASMRYDAAGPFSRVYRRGAVASVRSAPRRCPRRI